MATPARQVRAGATSPTPARTTPSSPQRPKLRVVPPAPKRRRRRHAGMGFWILSGAILGGMIVTLAVMYALLAQGSFELSELSAQQRALTTANTDLRIQIEDLSSTRRVSAWAEDHRLVMPAGYEVITAADIRDSRRAGPSRDRAGGDG